MVNLEIEKVDSVEHLNPKFSFDGFKDFHNELALMVIDRAKLQIDQIKDKDFVVIRFKDAYTWLTKKQYNEYNSIKHIS